MRETYIDINIYIYICYTSNNNNDNIIIVIIINMINSARHPARTGAAMKSIALSARRTTFDVM